MVLWCGTGASATHPPARPPDDDRGPAAIPRRAGRAREGEIAPRRDGGEVDRELFDARRRRRRSDRTAAPSASITVTR
jgi:hypothetical protein